jgi:hypothetical protein
MSRYNVTFVNVSERYGNPESVCNQYLAPESRFEQYDTAIYEYWDESNDGELVAVSYERYEAMNKR